MSIKLLLGIFLFLISPLSHAATQSYWAYFNVDNINAAQCSDGEISGIDFRLTLDIDDYKISQAYVEKCSGTTFLNKEPVPLSNWALGLGEGVNGSALIEGMLPWSLLGKPAQANIMFASSGNGSERNDTVGFEIGNTSSQWNLSAHSTTQKSESIAVPTLSQWGIFLLSAMIALSFFFYGRKHLPNISWIYIILFIPLIITTSVLAASIITIDGKGSDWTKNTLLISDLSGDQLDIESGDILDTYSTTDANNLFLRLDVKLTQPPAPAGVTFENGKSAYKIAEVVTLQTDQVKIEEVSYDATIDSNTPVKLTRLNDNSLGFLMPVATSGVHTLSFDLNKTLFKLKFTVTETPAIENPTNYINTTFDTLSKGIEQDITNYQPEADSTTLVADLNEIHDNLTAQRTAFASLSDTEKAWVASFIEANLQADEQFLSPKAVTSSQPKAWNQQACEAVMGTFSVNMMKTIKRIYPLAIALLASEPFISKIAAVIALGFFVDSLIDTINAEKELLNACLTKSTDELMAGNNDTQKLATLRATTAPTPLAFISGEARLFSIRSTYELPSSAKTIIQSLLNGLDPISFAIPDSMEKPFRDALLPITKTSSPKDYSISGISNSKIAGSLTVNGNQASIIFTRNDNEKEDIPFTFNLNNDVDGNTEIKAIISPMLASTWTYDTVMDKSTDAQFDITNKTNAELTLRGKTSEIHIENIVYKGIGEYEIILHSSFAFININGTVYSTVYNETACRDLNSPSLAGKITITGDDNQHVTGKFEFQPLLLSLNCNGILEGIWCMNGCDVISGHAYLVGLKHVTGSFHAKKIIN